MQTFPGSPCAGRIDASFVDGLEVPGSDNVALGLAYVVEDRSSCRIDINRSVVSDPEVYCAVWVHEYGHQAGFKHSEDVKDIMFRYTHRFEPCSAELGPKPWELPASDPYAGYRLPPTTCKIAKRLVAARARGFALTCKQVWKSDDLYDVTARKTVRSKHGSGRRTALRRYTVFRAERQDKTYTVDRYE